MQISYEMVSNAHVRPLTVSRWKKNEKLKELGHGLVTLKNLA